MKYFKYFYELFTCVSVLNFFEDKLCLSSWNSGLIFLVQPGVSYVCLRLLLNMRVITEYTDSMTFEGKIEIVFMGNWHMSFFLLWDLANELSQRSLNKSFTLHLIWKLFSLSFRLTLPCWFGRETTSDVLVYRWSIVASFPFIFFLWMGGCHLHQTVVCQVGWGCRIHRLHLCRGVRRPNECPGYDTKQSDGEVPAMLELWGMQSTPLLPSLPGPLWPGVVVPDRALSMG